MVRRGFEEESLSLTRSRVQPVPTHLRTFAIGPGYTQGETRKAKFAKKVSSKVSLNAKIKVETKGFAKVIAKVIAKASAELGVGMVRRKVSTSTSAVKVTEPVPNKTKNENLQYVFYKGLSVGSGKFTKTVCGTYYASPDRTNVYYRVTRYPGTYRSYGADGS